MNEHEATQILSQLSEEKIEEMRKEVLASDLSKSCKNKLCTVYDSVLEVRKLLNKEDVCMEEIMGAMHIFPSEEDTSKV